MRRVVLGGGIFLAAALGCAALLSAPVVQASETYEKATGLKCEDCHKHTKEQFSKDKVSDFEATKDLKTCGKESLEFLKKQAGFKELQKGEERSDADAKKWAIAHVKGKWKCSLQPAQGKPLPK
jgi:hypothetical protein